MGLKSGESLDETSGENALTNDAIPTIKSRICEMEQHTASETSNVISGNSSHGPEGHDGNNIDSKPPSGKSISCNPNQETLGVGSYSQLGGETLNYSREQSKSVAKEVVSKTLSAQRSASCTSDEINDLKNCFVGGKSEPSLEDCPKREAERDSFASDLPAEDRHTPEQLQDDAKETSVQSYHESDESDIVEHDVKVCDICGDSGREDLLAVCCRCSDGAEHTYCMQEMLDKVPEGDWLCEDCQLEEQKDKEKYKYGENGVGKYQSVKHVGSKKADLCVKLDGKDPDVESNKTDKDSSSLKYSRKRNADDPEVSSVSKRQAVEPKVTSPKRVGMLSRDSSFKNLDRGKVKPAHQSPRGVQPANDTPEAASPILGGRQQTPRSSFLKSNSFSTASAKPKVKPVDQAVLQKQKSTREAVSLDMKGGPSRIMSKSISFKSSSGRLSSGDSKVKMLSPKFSHVQDLKGKHTKERIYIERNSSFKSERHLINSTVASSNISSPRADKKLSARGETVLYSSTSNNREPKAVPSDSKLSQLSRPVDHVISKSSEVAVPTGDVKRQLPLSAKGVENHTEQKSIQGRMKNNSSSTSLSTDRPICKPSESLADALPQARDCKDVAENNIKESSNNPKQGASGKCIPCQKCKDISHTTECCVVDSLQQPLAPDVLTSRNSKDTMNKGNRLKAAIEAAMLKKPGIYNRKNRVPDQSDELSMSSINSDISSQDQMTNSSNSKKLAAGEEMNGELANVLNSNAESTKLVTGIAVKHLTQSAEAVTSRTGNKSIPSVGKPFMLDLPSHTFVPTAVLSMKSAIPEHEYIWQGCFEVHRSGNLLNLYDGFQAHKSTCATPRVVETANKFPRKILLNEVPRLNTWPVQFEETGVKEDHIALYFFARDYESYEKSYKTLLDNMTRNDLALKGNIDGVEILIFPSNQLPVKSQRWNMMFFLWGVFRGKRVNCLQQAAGSPKKISTSSEVPTAIAALPGKTCSPVPVDGDLSTHSIACKLVSEVHQLIDLQQSPPSETTNGDSDTKVISVFQKDNSAKLTAEQPEYRVDCNSFPIVQIRPVQMQPEIMSTTTSMDDNVESDCKVDREPQASSQVTASASGSNNINDEKVQSHHSNTSFDRQASPRYFSKMSAGVQDLASSESVSEVNIPDRTSTDKDQLKSRNMKIEGLLETETVQVRGMSRVSSSMDLNNWTLNQRKLSSVDSRVTRSEATFACSSQTVLWNGTNTPLADEGSASKKQKLDYSDLYGFTDRTSSSRDDSRSQDMSLSSPMKKRYDEGCDDTSVDKTLGNAETERFFFPVNQVKHVGLGVSSMPWKRILSDNEQQPIQERVPNLELALGAEMKPPLKQSLPPFLVKNNRDQPARGRTPPKSEEDDASAALSLSLSFPFPDKDQAVQSVGAREQLRHVNPSPLFGGFSDK